MVTLQTVGLKGTPRPAFLFATFATFAFVVTALVGVTRAQAQRIISIIPATTEMLFAMGAGDRVVAIGSYDKFPPEVEKLPRVGALLDPDVERIISLRPDLVVLYGTQQDLRTQLDRARIPYFPYVHKGLPDISETIRALGARIGAGDRANSLAARLEQQIREVRARVASRPKVTTLVVFGRERGTLRGIDASGGYGFLHDMLEAAGGTNVLAEIKTQAVQMSTEMVLARAPEVILELHYGRNDSNADLKPWDTLGTVPAVRNKRVYLLQGEEFVVPGPRVGNATERLAKTLHPEVFR
jgi:iron complex transport system substrate-binding protein